MAPEFDYATYGKIDGLNDWRDFHEVVIFGQNYLNEVTIINSIMAIQGTPEGEWFGEEFRARKDDFMRKHRKHPPRAAV